MTAQTPSDRPEGLRATVCPDCHGCTYVLEWGRTKRTCNRCQGTGREWHRDAAPRHIISATKLATGEQLAMCGHRFPSYQAAVDAGHVVGNYLRPTFDVCRYWGVTCGECVAAHVRTDNVERQLGTPIHCEPCGAVSSTVQRDRDGIARCDACSREAAAPAR